MRNLTVAIDGNIEFPTWCRRPSDYVNARSLAAGVAEDTTVPAGAGKVLFSCTGNFYAKMGTGSAAVPGDVADGTAAELNPGGWVVTAGDVISVIAPAICVLTLSYYK